MLGMRKKTLEEFIEESRSIYGDKYDYSLINEYVDNSTKVKVVCPEHGVFLTPPRDFLRGHACPKCGYKIVAQKERLTIEQVVDNFRGVHGDKYDYSLIENYEGTNTVLPIICPKHGVFYSTYLNHKKGCGCRKCGMEKVIKLNHDSRLTIDEVKKRIISVHGNKYDFPNDFVYTGKRNKIRLLCPEHGEFDGLLFNILKGQGCPKCKVSKLEETVRQSLNENDIIHIDHFKSDWLGKQHLDFYLPKQKIGIECQGEQHFIPVDFEGRGVDAAINKLKTTTEKDIEKLNKCIENNVTLLYFGKNRELFNQQSLYTNDNSYTDINLLIEEIRKK